mmetsp:Transcript_19065/g.19333  ORF Transcript_19065/g.19333 Transcript_19065/m.19333 type:complete len:83 (-) Transcript_19065:266-514(-)
MNGRLNIGKCQKTVFPGWAFLFFCFPLLSYSNLFLSGASFCGVNAFYLFRLSKIVTIKKELVTISLQKETKQFLSMCVFSTN